MYLNIYTMFNWYSARLKTNKRYLKVVRTGTKKLPKYEYFMECLEWQKLNNTNNKINY